MGTNHDQLQTPTRKKPMIDLDDDSDNNKSDPNRKDLLRKSIIRVKKPNLPESESKLKENFTTK